MSKKRIDLRLEENLHGDLKKLADVEGTSINKYVINLIEKAVEKNPQKIEKGLEALGTAKREQREKEERLKAYNRRYYHEVRKGKE